MATLALYAPNVASLAPITWIRSRVLKITSNPQMPAPLRATHALLVDGPPPSTHGFALVLSRVPSALDGPTENCLFLDGRLDYLSDGDVVRFDPANSSIKTLWRRSANSNAFLLTERCNSFCLMCSQPPRDIEDSFLLDEVLDAIPLIDRDAKEIGLTGGEPAIYGDRLASLVHTLKLALPHTAVHVLTNGRLFSDASLAASLAAVNHPDLMLGIPIYSRIAEVHDFIVQAKGAFAETIQGILNLKEHGVRVEIRVVVHRQTTPGLLELANFISRNLLFVDHVALMGLEVTGFTRANLGALLVSPDEYAEDLTASVLALNRAGLRVSIYNHPLCALSPDVWPWAVRSISDWKNEYAEVCRECDVLDRCGGLFATSRANPQFTPKALQVSK
jgi:His-Xaa-Ser system radical SAM maturase HxsC